MEGLRIVVHFNGTETLQYLGLVNDENGLRREWRDVPRVRESDLIREERKAEQKGHHSDG